MKGSFNLKLNNSRSVFSHRRKRSNFWFILILSLVVGGYFLVPKLIDFIPKAETGQPAPSETIIKTIPLPDIESLRTAQHTK